MRRIIERVELFEKDNMLLIRRTFWSRVIDTLVLLCTVFFLGVLLSCLLYYFVEDFKKTEIVADVVTSAIFIVFGVIEFCLIRKLAVTLFRYSQFLILDRVNMDFRQGRKFFGVLTEFSSVEIEKREDQDGKASFYVSLAIADSSSGNTVTRKLDIPDAEFEFSSYESAMNLSFALSNFLHAHFSETKRLSP